jgi:protocatechuate 3,4-dioxygenase alpha subunit
MPIAVSSATIGPYWHLLDDPTLADMTRFGVAGEVIEITGRITDGVGNLVTDACVELWQTSPAADDTFDGFGRCRTDDAGRFRFRTVKPGPTPGLGNAQQAPHVALTILARGLTKGLASRIYFAGDSGHDTDPVLTLIEDPARRATLIASPSAPGVWFIDIVLQGAGETVFFDV